jgi:hypothetical protein
MKYPNSDFSLGVFAGFTDGQTRVGVYTIEEEVSLSYDKAEMNMPDEGFRRINWAEGYRYGYKLGASGDTIPDMFCQEV